jgi:F-type H+-transporting ATPase subunit delta
LLELSLTGSVPDAAKAREVTGVLLKSGHPQTREILVEYRDAMARRLKFCTLQISHAGALGSTAVSELKTSFERQAGHSLSVETTEDASLIAGLKVRLGDYVYEQSIKHALQNFAQTLTTSH